MSEPGAPGEGTGAGPGPEGLHAERERREARADEGGGRVRQQRHQRLGRLTARERIAALCDPGSFVEMGRHLLHRHSEDSEALAANLHPGDGLVCGLGAVSGRTVAVYAHDPTVLRGALGHAAARKLCRLLDLAGERGHPVIALVDCDGVRVEEGTDAIDAYGEVIRRTVRLQGKVPQLTLCCGLCVGAAVPPVRVGLVLGIVKAGSFEKKLDSAALTDGPFRPIRATSPDEFEITLSVYSSFLSSGGVGSISGFSDASILGRLIES